jgi:hypothetical protein
MLPPPLLQPDLVHIKLPPPDNRYRLGGHVIGIFVPIGYLLFRRGKYQTHCLGVEQDAG